MVIAREKVKSSAGTAVREPRIAGISDPPDELRSLFDESTSVEMGPVTVAEPGIFYNAFKRGVDIFYSLVFLILGIPWLLVCGLLMKREAPGPFFYKQDRVGKDGKLLNVYKLRSMPVDAEENGPQLTPINGDKRCGPVGRFIRKAKIDELPQFWNVLIGEFSVVGPRPERPYFARQFAEEFPHFNERHLVKPGLTGLAQVNEKDALKMRHKLKYDLFYVENRSIGLDLSILWVTAMYCFKCLFSGFRESVNGNSCDMSE